MIVTDDLIRRIELSEAGRVKACAQAFGGEFLEAAGGIASFCGEGSVATQCAGMGLEGEVSAEEFESIRRHYRGRCRQFEFKLSPIAALSLRELVVRHAVSLPEFETLLVTRISDHHLPESELDFREVARADAHAHAKRAAWWFSGDNQPPGIVEIIAATCVGENVVSCEVYMDGRPVAGCSLGFGNGIAWLNGASVEPEYRGRGIHKAMQAYRMRIAQERGHDLICQGAFPGSISQQNAQKNGFAIAFTRPTFMVATEDAS